MAERINPADVTFRRRGAPTRYPWNTWMDGSMWHLKQGTDYRISTRDFRAVVHKAARRNGMTVHTRETDHGLVVTFHRTDAKQSGNRARHFLPDTDLARVITLTQAEIDEDPKRLDGLTELQIITATWEAA